VKTTQASLTGYIIIISYNKFEMHIKEVLKMDRLEKLVSDLEDLRSKDERLQEIIDNLKNLNSEIDLNTISKKKVKRWISIISKNIKLLHKIFRGIEGYTVIYPVVKEANNIINKLTEQIETKNDNPKS